MAKENENEQLEERIDKAESKLKSILSRKFSVKEYLSFLAVPVCALIGTCYSANKRLDEKKLDVEIERIKYKELIEAKRIEMEAKQKMLDRICHEVEEENLPDRLSIGILNDINK